MLKKSVKKICLGGILIALSYVFTMFISIPLLPAGYINLSDFFIVFTTISIDPMCGLLVSIIAPALADLSLGYYIYIPFTILAKTFEFLLIYIAFYKCKGVLKYCLLWLGPLVMALTYIIPDLFVLGFDQYLVALLNFVYNFLQGILGLVIGLIMYNLFKKINYKIK